MEILMIIAIIVLIFISISLGTIASSLVSINVRLSELKQEVRNSKY